MAEITKNNSGSDPGKTPRGLRWLFLGLALAFYLTVLGLEGAGNLNPYHMQILSLVCINIVLAVSLNLINGFTGQFSLGHAGFMAVGAYVSAFLSRNVVNPMSLPGIEWLDFLVRIGLFLLVILAGAVAAAILGFLVGLPTLRLRGDYLAIATLGLGEIIRIILINLDVVGGARGYAVPKYTNFTWAFVLMVFAVLIIANLINSTHGRAFISVREDEIAAEAMGINTTRYKVLAFSIGAFFAGLSGALFAHLFVYISPQIFDFLRSIDILVMVVLGGLGSITGSITAAVFVTLVTEMLRQFVELRVIIFSLILIIVMLIRPQGLLGTREVTDLFRRKRGDQDKFPQHQKTI